MGREEMRAADRDRQTVADRLKTALDEGRLDLHEYDERLQRAYAAKTYGELEALLTDLPVPAVLPPERQQAADHVTRRWLMQLWSGYVPVVLITVGVWLVTYVSSSSPVYFWPIWVAGPWGLILVWQTVSGLSSGEPQRWQAKLDREERKKELKRERKALEREEKGDKSDS
jgi:hypothetical protein